MTISTSRSNEHRGSDDWYDPGADLAVRYPEWVKRERPIAPVPEVMCRRRRVILLDDSADSAQRRVALAHAVAHIDLDHVPGEQYTERDADVLAARRLITLEQLADVLAWALGPDEVAHTLDVTVHIVRVRLSLLSDEEKAWISQRLAEEAA